MNPSTSNKLVIPAIIVIVALIITYGVYWYGQSHAANVAVPVPVVTTQSPASPTASSSTMQVTTMVPNDLAAYEKAMIAFAQQGAGSDPSKTFPFVARTVTVPQSTDAVRASAEAAAEVIPTQAGTSSLVVYLKVVNGTAYVVLNMDIDGWAGVSTAIAEVHPLVEKTLLNLPGITAVKFGPAPGDTMDSIVKAYENQSATASSTISWKTYTNSQDGFSFMYPADFTVVNMTGGGEDAPGTSQAQEVWFRIYCTDRTSTCGDTEFGLTMDTATGTLDQYIANADLIAKSAYEGQPSVSITDSKRLSVGGMSAVRRDEFLEAAGFATVITYIKSEDELYSFMIIPGSSTFAGKGRDVYNQILSSFTFTN